MGEGRGGEGRGEEGRGWGLINFSPLKREGGLIREGAFIEDLRYLFKHHPELHPEWMHDENFDISY